MASVESMYEEKLSPKLDSNYNKEKVADNEKVINDIRVDGEGEEEGKTDAVLDEIAAKVHALDFRKDDEEENTHVKCMDTVRKQGETINTLVNQLRIMFEQYTEMNSEREYYEELNEALLRCLEITEGRLQIQEDSEDEDIKNLDTDNEGKTCISQPEDDPKEPQTYNVTETPDVKMEISGEASGGIEVKTEEKSDTEETDKKKDKTEKIKNCELKRLNRILLREIFELRQQIETLKENFRDYLNSEELSQSEYDTATDDDHTCNACTQCMRCKPTKQDDITSEEYEHQENETTKIADETDSD